MILNIFSCNSCYVVGHCITLLCFSYASKSVPLSTRKKPTNLDWAKVFFLPSSLMSNARNWCKLTDGGQIILIITNKQSLRNLTKFFEVAQKMQGGSPMKTIPRSVFPLSLTIWAGTAPLAILLTLYLSSTRFYLILQFFDPFSFVNLLISQRKSVLSLPAVGRRLSREGLVNNQHHFVICENTINVNCRC